MTATTETLHIAAPRPGGSLGRSVRDSLVVARRNLIRMTRIPEMVIFGLIQPIMFVVLFSYVFGGSMMIGGSTSPADYRNFLMAGIFAQTVTFATAGAGAGIADDMHKGLIDRFRSLPMARGAVLTGRTLADLVQTTLTLVVLAVVALLVGWRTEENAGKVLGGFALLLLLGYAFSWIGALIGLSVRTPKRPPRAASSGSFRSRSFRTPSCPPRTWRAGSSRSLNGTRSARPCRPAASSSATRASHRPTPGRWNIPSGPR